MIVVVIIGIIAAIAVPRLSRGSEGSAEAATVRNVAVLQKAVDLYAAEHCGAFPKADRVADQLTLFTDAQGVVSRQKTGAFAFGPYVKKVPALPTGPNRGAATIAAASGAGVGWVYNPTDGAIAANLTPAVAGGAPATGAAVPAASAATSVSNPAAD